MKLNAYKNGVKDGLCLYHVLAWRSLALANMSRSFEIFTYSVGRNGSEANHVPPDDSEDIEAAGLLEYHGVSTRPTYDSCADVSHCFPIAGKLMNRRWQLRTFAH